MSDRRTPIERLVDEACGVPVFHEVDGRDADGEWLILRCPGSPKGDCSKLIATERQPHDPPTATLVEIQCPECNGGDFDSPSYFDANGRDVTNAAPPKEGGR